MAGQSSLDGDLGGLVIANFTDHNDVRVGTQNRSQRVGERQSRLRIHLHLIDAFHPIFHRVFDRDDVHVRARYDSEARIQGGGLAGTRRAGHQRHTPGFHHRFAVAVEVHLIQAELLEGHVGGATIEDSNHDLLAPDRWQTRHTKVARFVADLESEATILWNTAFRDVHVAHDFDARQDLGLDALWVARGFVKHAVDSEPNAQVCLGWFNVDVRCAVLNCLGNQ